MRQRSAAFITLFVLAATVTIAQQPPVFTPFGALPVLDNYLEALRKQTGIPGMSAVVVREGVVIWEKGYGYQNTASKIPATPDTPYLVGDLSSTLAAVLLLQCSEHRQLYLDEPIRKYAGQLPEANITIGQVLSHTIPGLQEPFVYSPERYAQLTPVMEHCGEARSYRKSVAMLLEGAAMQDSVPGTDLWRSDQVLREGEFDRDDIDRYRRVLDRMAIPYKIDTRLRAERTELPPITMSAENGLVSTVRDLARLDAELDARRILHQETLDLAWNPVRLGTDSLGNDIFSPMGLGWFVQNHRGQRVVWHFGMIGNAYSSLLVKLPDQKITFILLANSDGLSNTFQLPAGNVTKSLFAALFLRLVT
jgi:CubicO group peptidase (beta-lactamase class C family)